MLFNKLGLQPAKKKFAPDDYFSTNSNVGIEVELEKATLPLDEELWEETYDGSLRNGVEYISNGPLNGKGLTRAINDFHIQALRAGYDEDVCCNHRCSTHVHVDMTDLKDEGQLYTFILLALFMEPVLFNSFENNLRKNSIYCVPLYEQDWYLKILNDCMRRNDLMGISANSQKYSSINLRRLVQGADEECALGTVEFRMFPSTLNGNDLRLWVNILLSMKKYALNHTVEDVRSLSNVLSHKGTRNFLHAIFGEEGADMLMPFAEYHRLIQGARTVERVLFDPNEKAIERLFDRKVEQRVPVEEPDEVEGDPIILGQVPHFDLDVIRRAQRIINNAPLGGAIPAPPVFEIDIDEEDDEVELEELVAEFEDDDNEDDF